MGELDKEFIEAQKELYAFFRKYKNLRDFVGWEHGYYDILVKHINDENISDEHRKSIIEQIITLQEFRNERNDTQSYYDLSMLSSKYYLKKKILLMV